MSAGGADASRPRRRVNYEVSVRRLRKWEVYATYTGAERDLALTDAKKMEKEGGVDGAKVTKETQDLETHKVESTVIFRSAALEKELAALAAERPRPPKPEPAPKGGKKPKTAAEKPTKPAVTTKVVEDFSMLKAAPAIIVGFLFSCMIGAAAAVGTSYSLQGVGALGLVLGRQAQIAILIGIFAISTAYSMFFLLRRIMRKAVTKRTVSIAQPGAVSDAAAASPQAAAGTATHVPKDQNRYASAERMTEAFTDQLLSRLTDGFERLDAGQRFALDVYVGGAIESLVQSLGLSREDFQALLAKPLQRLKAPAEMIERFGGLLEGYLSQARIREIYEMGRTAMGKLLAGETDAIDPDAALKSWEGAEDTTPAPAEWDAEDSVSRRVAVIYTDAVMPPGEGQNRKAARRIYKAHAKIARTALASLSGVEFEHGGDGILASFQMPAQAIDAALEIQRAIAEAEGNRKSATGLTARIGIDIGQSAREDGELVGDTVEIASFLSSRGAGGQILTSREVRDLCGDHHFDHRGDEKIEGLTDTVSYFELVPL